LPEHCKNPQKKEEDMKKIVLAVLLTAFVFLPLATSARATEDIFHLLPQTANAQAPAYHLLLQTANAQAPEYGCYNGWGISLRGENIYTFTAPEGTPLASIAACACRKHDRTIFKPVLVWDTIISRDYARRH
jgi:hypothetical protein